jgi:hypothetical protein
MNCSLSYFFLGAIFVISSQSGNDHLEEDLAKIGYKLNINAKSF